MALAIVLAICVSVIVVTYMLCGVCKSEHDLEKVYEDISLLRVSVDRFNSIEEVNANNLSCLSNHLNTLMRKSMKYRMSCVTVKLKRTSKMLRK